MTDNTNTNKNDTAAMSHSSGIHAPDQANIRAKVKRCHNMIEVREHIDALDEQIVALIAERGGYVAQAARIKQRADQVHDSARIEFIVERVVAQAHASGAPPTVLEATYRAMIDAFIAFEHGEFKRLREPSGIQPGATA